MTGTEGGSQIQVISFFTQADTNDASALTPQIGVTRPYEPGVKQPPSPPVPKKPSKERLDAMSHSWELLGPNLTDGEPNGWHDWRCTVCDHQLHLHGETNHPHYIYQTGDCATQLIESVMKV